MAKRRTRRKPGSGYTTQAPNKTWSAFYPKLGGGYHVRKGFGRRQDAEAWLDALATQRAAKVDVASGQQRLDTTIDSWATRAARERGWKAKTIADVQWKLAYVNPYLGGMALSDVMPDHVDAMFDELMTDLAETTIRQIRNYLYQVFESAVKRRYITFNPVIKPERRKRAKQRDPQRLSTAEAAQLVRAFDGSFYALAWWLILTLGLRAGEACGLRWGDLDLEIGVLTVAQAVGELRGHSHPDTPKGDKTRQLPIPRALLPLFRDHYAWYVRRASQGQHKGYWQEHGLVFPGRGGRPTNPGVLRHQLGRMTRLCSLPDVTTHMCRHTAAAAYTNAGCPQHLTSAILGHSTNITGHYAPPSVETLRPWVEQVYGQLAGEVERLQRATG
jgi:integrase